MRVDFHPRLKALVFIDVSDLIGFKVIAIVESIDYNNNDYTLVPCNRVTTYDTGHR